ncbi:hypothetical protein AHMF7605_18445 [Adhaeribacter arboris]|uniref:Uncharacterized protein n=1 Tax=Adhaeribacter arboris TaxID=2072846 RepID=A0A2T2YIM5_9BACT|nr:hypothetical protein [Adhaeribacter arboris]PSR55345.1 hypothetical protein AHMF7605_18445 [Adhaeribacter arboris]
MVDIVLTLCKNSGVKTLGETLLDNLIVGQVFCSTETFKGAGNKAYDKNIRIRNQILLTFKYNKKVYADFSALHFVADTGRLEQSRKSICQLLA